jgi:hypothetical protein
MTRRSITAVLSSLFVALFLGLVGTPLTTVSADGTCTGFAREQCERMQTTTGSTASFSIQAPVSAHWFTPGAVAREHFEAMSVLAPESYRMAPAPAVSGQFGQAEYDHVLMSMEKVVEVTAPVITLNDQQRYFEVNTAWLPAGTDAAAPALTSSQRWFLEVNTTMLPQLAPAYPLTEAVTPLPGHPR